MGIHKKFGEQISLEDLGTAEVIITLGDRSVVALAKDSGLTIEDVADALHVLSHKLYDAIDQWEKEAEKN